MESDGHTLDPKEASKMERAEIERRLEPFVTQLSAGLEHIQRIFARPLNCGLSKITAFINMLYCQKMLLY